MKFKRLLAKSISPVEEENNLTEEEAKEREKERKCATYLAHIAIVMQSARTITDDLGEGILEQLDLKINLERFKNTVKLGAYLHDWGKANQHFQEMVFFKSIHSKSQDEKLIKYRKKLLAAQREHNQRQMLRHEVISGILALEIESVRKWFTECEGINNDDLMIAVWAAMGHHLKMGIDEYGRSVDYCIAQIPDGTGDSLKIYTHHPDFTKMLEMGRKFGLGLPSYLPELPKQDWTRIELEGAIESLQQKFDDFVQKHQNDWEFCKYTAAVKATVMAADLAGSALPNAGENVREWIQKQLKVVLSEDGDDIQNLLDERLGENDLYEFQEDIAQTTYRVTLVKAGCGSGKTVGAYAWAKKWAKARKLFFCYPTTGTASQGFIDYADGAVEADLMHSRAELDRELLCSGDSGDAEGVDARLSALKAWRNKMIVCTVDTVLGLIQNNRRPLYAWCAIAQSAFVFDEVHAYDSRLFGALLQFLRTFRGAPILLMSASFTPEQIKAIRDVMAELGEKINQEPIKGPKKLEELKRYQIDYLDEVSDVKKLPEVWDILLEALRNNQKVLWVTNSVQSSIDFYQEAKKKISQELSQHEIKLLIYHSRFRYKDRLDKHKAVIDNFDKDVNIPVLAITTQVCEMSLDINADLLVSAIAPAAALIQRMGRLNRRIKDQSEGTRRAIIYPWENKQPYSKEELETGIELIKQLPSKNAVSQVDLADISEKLNSSKPSIVKSNWLEGNWCTHPGFLREAGYTITVLLEEDEKKIWKIAEAQEQELLKQGKKESRMKLFMKEALRWSVPIRIVKGFKDWKRRKFYPIAPKDIIKYSEETGAEPCK